jgi:hypothetical protein
MKTLLKALGIAFLATNLLFGQTREVSSAEAGHHLQKKVAAVYPRMAQIANMRRYGVVREKRPELCGVTIHRVDTGIDTGQVLAQDVFTPKPDDNFATYPWIQLGLGLRLLAKLLPDVIQGRAVPSQPLTTESKLRTHPTIWGYCWCRVVHGVR